MEIILPEKADAIISFRADPELQARIKELAQKSTEGELTDDERSRAMCARMSSSPSSSDRRNALPTLSSDP